MTNVPEPADPVIRMEMTRDPLLQSLWAEYCQHQVAQGYDPNTPSPYTRSFRDFANYRIEPFLEGAGRAQYEGWKTVGASEIAIRAEERGDVAGRVARWWGEALDLLDQLLSVSEEFGMFHIKRLASAPDRFPRTYPLLIDLHSRGVQVGEETLALLRCGFAAGAEARWRTLHETAVVAAFIAKHGTETVERYAEHDHVRVKKAMDSEQEHHRELGLEPYTDEEMKEAADRYEELRRKYGAVFLGDYGWAAHALGRKPDGKPPTFMDIEASLNLRVHRAAYKSASQAIHAGPGALVDNPGKSEGATPLFLTRGTEFGLLEPGARTAGSLGLLARALMEWRPFPFDRIALQAMGHMVMEVGARFFACERRLSEEMARRQTEDAR
jgi:hypothetical protein